MGSSMEGTAPEYKLQKYKTPCNENGRRLMQQTDTQEKWLS